MVDVFVFIQGLVPKQADKDLVQMILPRALDILVPRVEQGRSKEMKSQPFHCSVVFQNSRTAKISPERAL